MSPLKPSDVHNARNLNLLLNPHLKTEDSRKELNACKVSWDAESKTLAFKANGYYAAAWFSVILATITVVGVTLCWMLLATTVPFHWEVTILIAAGAAIPVFSLSFIAFRYLKHTALKLKVESDYFNQANIVVTNYIINNPQVPNEKDADSEDETSSVSSKEPIKRKNSESSVTSEGSGYSTSKASSENSGLRSSQCSTSSESSSSESSSSESSED